MASAGKNMIYGSMAASGVVAVASVVDMIVGYPFAGSMLLDIMFLVGAGLIIYLCLDAYKDIG